MQIFGMEDTLIQIQSIKNITSIRLNGIIYTQDDKEKMELVPILSVTYDGNKSLSLTSKEKYFDAFVKKVTEVYNDEKNNIIEDSLTDPFRLRSHIQIDEHTKEVLESGRLTNLEDIYKYYDDKKPYSNSLLFQKDEFRLLLPIIKYHLEDLFSRTDNQVKFGNDFQGYRDNFILTANVDGIEKTINMYIYKENDNEYLISIGGIFSNYSSIEMSIKFKNDRIEVIMNSISYELYSEYIYQANNEKIKQVVSISKSNRPIIYENKDLEESENVYHNITDLDSKSNFRWFKLPWNALYGINNEVNSLSGSEKMIKTYSMYVLVLDNSFMKKENYSKTFKKSSNVTITTEDLVMDEVMKNTTCICISPIENLYAIETAFLNTRYPNGYYLEKLINKYFYHVVKSEEGVCAILLANGISINKDDVLVNADLIDTQKMLNLIKGSK